MSTRRPLDPDLYAEVVAEAKSRFKVWPSAYASGWVVRTYKERGGRYAGEARGQRSGLTKWFGEEWVDLSRPIYDEDGELVGYEQCGRKASDDPADYPKCRPFKEAMRMSPEEVEDAVRRKRRAEKKAEHGGRGARAPVRVATYRRNPDVTRTLWRAADDDHIGDSASFAESREVAELYLDNPGFGGSRLYRARITPRDVLDLTGPDGLEVLTEALGKEPRYGGAINLDELVPRIAEDICEAGYQWVRVPESYPEGTVTWVYVGGPDGDEPVLVEVKARSNPDITRTQAFRRWFGESKVVDENGEPLVVYHGAPDVRGIFAGGFKQSPMRGDVFFATDDPRTAETYTDPHRAWDYQNAEPGVIPLYLRIENPLVVDAGFQHWRGTEHVIEKARKAGHDGVIIENTIDHYASDRKAKPRREDACTVFAFFSPTQVKSALTEPMKARDPNRWHVSTAQPLAFTGPNDGTFDLDDPDLRSNPYDPEDDPLSDV